MKGRLDDPCQWHATEVAGDFEKPAYGTRRRHRRHADKELLLRCPEITQYRIEIAIVCIGASERRLDEKVIENGRAVDGTGEKESAPAERRQDRFGNTGSSHRRHRRIKGIAAVFQHGAGRSHRFRVTRRYRATALPHCCHCSIFPSQSTPTVATVSTPAEQAIEGSTPGA